LAESAYTLAFSDADAFALLVPVALITFSRVTSGTVHFATAAAQESSQLENIFSVEEGVS